MPITDDAPAFERQGFLKEDFRLFHLKDKISPLNSTITIF